MGFNFGWTLLGIILKKLSSKQLYSLLISAIDHHQATLQKYFDNLFPDIKLLWKKST